MTTNYIKRLLSIPNGCKIFRTVIKYNNIFYIFLGPPNFTKIGIFGLKTNHLAALGNSATLHHYIHCLNIHYHNDVSTEHTPILPNQFYLVCRANC
jgi:hypothetical protein